MQRGRGKAKGRDPALTNHTKMVQWASSLLDTRYRKIGDLLHSHLFCQLFDASAPGVSLTVCAQDERSNHYADLWCAFVFLAGKVNMHKVRWEPISDAQHLENFRVLQDAFAKAGVQRVRLDSPSMHHDWHTHELVHLYMLLLLLPAN